MRLLRSPWAKSLSFRGNLGGRLAQGNGRGSRPVTQVWFGIAAAAVLTDSPSGTRRESLPQIPASPEKAPIRQDRTRGVIAILVREGR